jgi:CO/xanthine dehydrogenase FAD-binding subunit
MVIARDFDFFKPKNLKEALKLKSDYGSRGSFLAGGTDLIVNIEDGALETDAVIDLKGIKELKELKFNKDSLFIGCLITYNELLENSTIKKEFPLLWEAASNVASGPLRNRATMVGNLCSCVPCLDSGPPTVIYEASLVISSPDGDKTISIFDFLLGPRKTALKDSELVKGVILPRIKTKKGECFVKLKRYKGEDLAQASVGIMALPRNKYRVAFGSVGPIPIRAKKIEELLNGKKLTPALIEKAKDLIPQEISPITDIRSSKEYRLLMSKVMFERGLNAAVARLSGKGPKTGTSLI